MKKKVNFKGYDGTDLVGILSMPESVNKAILMIHGIPSDKDEWGFYKDMADFFYERNVATFRFDFRYNGESQKGSLSELTLSEMINDIESAYWQLVKELNGIITNIFIIGTSCGGGVTVKWYNVFNHRIDKIFLNAPVLDYEYEVTSEEQKDRGSYSQLSFSNLEILSEQKGLNVDIGYGYPMINESHLFNIRNEFERCYIPITIFHGNEDTVVPLYLTKNNIKGFNNIELIIVDKADHGFAIAGDDDLTAKGTKENHFYVYNEIFKRL